MKDMKKVRKLLQEKDLHQTLQRYPLMSSVISPLLKGITVKSNYLFKFQKAIL